MITITVQRRNQNDVCTTGAFKASSAGADTKGLVTGYTLEPPWRDNQRNISCIPAGRYKAYLREKETSKWDYDIIELKDVSGRSYIQFHSGNYPKNTNGCILTGTSQGKNAVWESRKKLQELIEFVKADIQATGDEEFVVIVKDPV